MATRRKRAGNQVLREFRRQILKVSQREMGAATGLNSVHLSQIENGADGLQLGRDAALRILDAYRDELLTHGITLEDLLRGTRARAAA